MNIFPRPANRNNLLTLLIVIALASISGCQSRSDREARTVPPGLTLAVQHTPYSGLIAIADERGFFKDHGVEVILKEYSSGLECLKAMYDGEVDLATVADIAFAGRIGRDSHPRVVSSIGLTVGNLVVARKDRGITRPADLKGKRVGYSPNTTSDYFLHAFVLANHISPADITRVSIPPARQVEAVLTGEVDAISAFEVNAFTAKQRLGENAVSWETQNSVAYHWLLATRQDTATRIPEPIKGLLRALLDAKAFVLIHQDEAKRILSNKWGLSPEYVREAWTQTRFDVSLNQSIVISLETYVKWYMDKEGKTGEIPDVLNYIHTGLLDRIDPKLVTIFR